MKYKIMFLSIFNAFLTQFFYIKIFYSMKNLKFNYLKTAINFWIDPSFMFKFYHAIEQFNANIDHENQFKKNVDAVHQKLQVWITSAASRDTYLRTTC